MRILYVKYALWKDIVDKNVFDVFHKVVATDTVKVWAGSPETVFSADIEPGTDYTDFSTNFETYSTEVPDEDSAIANIVGLGNPLQPRTDDGRPIMIPVRFRGNVTPFFAGSEDSPAGRGAGSLFILRWNNAPTSAESKEQVFSFSDWIYLAKGHIHWENAGSGDYAGISLEAPATTVVANPGAGNCNLVPTGLGFNVIVTAPGDGSHDYSDPVPVPAFGPKGNPIGNWTWSEPDTGKGTVTFVGDGRSPYNLYDARITLSHWIKKLALVGSGMQTLHPEGKAKKILPHWEFRVLVRNKYLSTLMVTWNLDGARKVTV